MKLVKSLLLGSAAGIVAVGSAVAADLPVRKAAPVDYVQVCSAFGTGYFYIPGTDTCLKIGGEVRWTGTFTERNWTTANTALLPAGAATRTPNTNAGALGRNTAKWGQTTRARLDVDARTATEFGTLRSFIRLEGSNAGTTTERAFIEFAGWTFGRTANQFSAGGDDSFAGFGGIRGGTVVNQASYTMDLGGASATISVQDHTATNQARFNQPFFNAPVPNVRAYTNNSTGMPDIVANVKAKFGDVDLHLGGALTQLRTQQFQLNAGATGFVSTEYGYALTASAKFGLGAVSPGTSFEIRGQFAEGALWYTNPLTGAGRYTLDYADAYIVNDSVRKTQSWNIYGALKHAWAPNVSQTVYGVYGAVDVPGSVKRQFGAGDTRFNLVTDAVGSTYWGLGSNIAWTPVAGLIFGAEVNYQQVKADNRILVSGTAQGNDAIYKRTSDQWTASLRVTRSF